MAAVLRQTGAHRIYLLGRRLAEGIQTLETSPHPSSTGPSSDAPSPGGSGFRILVPIECDVTSASSISTAAADRARERLRRRANQQRGHDRARAHRPQRRADHHRAAGRAAKGLGRVGGHDGHGRVVRRWRLRHLPAAAGRREPPPRVGGRQAARGSGGGRSEARAALRPSARTMSVWRRLSPLRASAAICAGRWPGWR